MSVTSLMYDRSRAAGDNALSAPPGIAEFLQVKGQCPIKRSPALGHKSIHRTTGRGKKAGRRSLCEQHVVNVIQVRSILKRKKIRNTYGFIAMPHIAWKTSAICPVLTLTATGTANPSLRQYTSGWTSCRWNSNTSGVSFTTHVYKLCIILACCARSRSDFVAIKIVGMWSRL